MSASTTIVTDFRDDDVARQRLVATLRRGASVRCEAGRVEGARRVGGRRVSTRRGKLMTLTAPAFERRADEPNEREGCALSPMD